MAHMGGVDDLLCGQFLPLLRFTKPDDIDDARGQVVAQFEHAARGQVGVRKRTLGQWEGSPLSLSVFRVFGTNGSLI